MPKLIEELKRRNVIKVAIAYIVVAWTYEVTPARATTNTTPFDAWHMPIENETHVTLTELNVEFALNEIFQETLSTDVNNQNTISIEQNPITDVLTILCSSTFEQAKVSVVYLTGKMVYNTT